MKKRPILTFFITLLVFSLIYIVLIGVEVYRIFNFVSYSEKTHSNRHKIIGIKGLCTQKKLDYDDNKKNISNSLDNLIKQKSQYLDFYISYPELEDFSFKFFDNLQYSKQKNELEISTNVKIDYNYLNELKTQIKTFDNSFDINSIKDYSWNMFNEINSEKEPIKTNTIFHSTDLCKLCNLISLIDLYSFDNDEIADSSTLFSSMIKIHLLNLYTNKGIIGLDKLNHNLESVFVFFDKIRNDKYSNYQMKKMLMTIKKANDLLPDFKDNIEIHYKFTKNFYDFAFYQFPLITFTLRPILGNPYKSLEELYKLCEEGKYKESKDTYNKYDSKQKSSLFMLQPDFYKYKEIYDKSIDVNSRLALIQAYLEEKLGEKITALDPFDRKPIRFIIDEKGNKVFYCLGHEGKDVKGSKANITNCDTKLKESLIAAQANKK